MLKSGVVLFYTPMGIIFDETFKRPKEMVELLKDRGLTIDDPQRTEHYLRNIGYYRLSAYMYPFLQSPKEAHRFKQGSKFQNRFGLLSKARGRKDNRKGG